MRKKANTWRLNNMILKNQGIKEKNQRSQNTSRHMKMERQLSKI